MAATAIPIDTLSSINPATGEVLAQIEKTPPAEVLEIVASTRDAQCEWAKVAIRAKLRNARSAMKTYFRDHGL